MKKLLFAFFVLILIQPIVHASEEGVLKLSDFTIKSNGIGNSGPVVITGSKNDQNEFTDLKINAFANEYKISDRDLAKIPPVSYNGIQLSYEEGYKELGGRTIYIIFQRGFTSGINKKVLLSLAENGSVTIKDEETINLVRNYLKKENRPYRNLEITNVTFIDQSKQKIRFTFLSNEEYFVGHALIDDGKLIIKKIGTK